MLDNVLGMIILFLTVFLIFLSLFIVKNWNKKHLVKELFFNKATPILWLGCTIAVVIILIPIYFESHDWRQLLIASLGVLLLLFMFYTNSTKCVYLKNECFEKRIFSIVKRLL